MWKPDHYFIWHILHVLHVLALFTVLNHCLVTVKASSSLCSFFSHQLCAASESSSMTASS